MLLKSAKFYSVPQPVILYTVQQMPTSEYEDDEVEKLYDTIEGIFEEDGKGDTINIILGDWNSVVGDESYRNIVGSHGLEIGRAHV
jgi:hypothetical protein